MVRIVHTAAVTLRERPVCSQVVDSATTLLHSRQPIQNCLKSHNCWFMRRVVAGGEDNCSLAFFCLWSVWWLNADETRVHQSLFASHLRSTRARICHFTTALTATLFETVTETWFIKTFCLTMKSFLLLVDLITVRPAVAGQWQFELAVPQHAELQSSC